MYICIVAYNSNIMSVCMTMYTRLEIVERKLAKSQLLIYVYRLTYRT